MEFEELRNFWISQSHVKRKYPMIITYNKYLSNIFEEKHLNLQCKEVELFKKWLVENPNLNNKEFNSQNFKTGKQSVVLDVKNFLRGDETNIEKFWKDLWAVETIMFPNGKPSQSFIQNVIPSLGDNPLATGIFDKILESEQTMALVNNAVKSGDMIDLASFIECPDFWNVIENMKHNFSNGTYTDSHVKATINEVINFLQQNANPENSEKIDVVVQAATETLTAIEKGQAPNIMKILNIMASLTKKS